MSGNRHRGFSTNDEDVEQNLLRTRAPNRIRDRDSVAKRPDESREWTSVRCSADSACGPSGPATPAVLGIEASGPWRSNVGVAGRWKCFRMSRENGRKSGIEIRSKLNEPPSSANAALISMRSRPLARREVGRRVSARRQSGARRRRHGAKRLRTFSFLPRRYRALEAAGWQALPSGGKGRKRFCARMLRQRDRPKRSRLGVAFVSKSLLAAERIARTRSSSSSASGIVDRHKADATLARCSQAARQASRVVLRDVARAAIGRKAISETSVELVTGLPGCPDDRRV